MSGDDAQQLQKEIDELFTKYASPTSEYEVILGGIRAWVERKKTSNGLRNGREVIAKSTKMVSRSYISSVSIYFTATTIFISIVNIIFQRIIEPAGGEGLYRNLLFLFGTIFLGVLTFSMFRLLGVKEKKHHGSNVSST